MATGGVDTLQQLTADERRAVETAVADNVLEGWDPSLADISRLARLAAGEIAFEDYYVEIAEATRRR